jgi:hypothetical protein
MGRSGDGAAAGATPDWTANRFKRASQKSKRVARVRVVELNGIEPSAS